MGGMMIRGTNQNHDNIPENLINSVNYSEDDNDTSVGDIEPEPLLAAAREGRTNDVMLILEKDRDLILAGDLVEDTALHVAARAGHEETVLKLIQVAEQHSRLERVLKEVNVDGDTALLLALKNGHRQAAIYLMEAQRREEKRDQAVFVEHIYLQSSADIEMKLVRRALKDEEEEEEQEVKIDISWWWTLLRSALYGDEVGVRRMLRLDPYLLWHVDSDEGTVLHVSAKARQEGTLKQLIQFAIINFKHNVTRLLLKRDGLGDTILHLALKRGLESVAHYLIELAPQAVYQENKKGFTPLYLAIEKEHEDLVRYLIDKTSEALSLKPSLLSHVKKHSLAHIAIKTRNLGILQALMEKFPCLINSSNEKGWKPHSYAASKGYLNQVCYLLEKFPDSLNQYDRDGSFPIHKAIAAGHINIVKKFLLHCPQTLCAVDKKGRSNLHIAVRYVKRDILSYLLKKECVEEILTLRDSEGKTFMDLARKLKNGSMSGSTC